MFMVKYEYCTVNFTMLSDCPHLPPQMNFTTYQYHISLSLSLSLSTLQYLDVASSLPQFGYRQLDDVEFDHPREGMKGIILYTQKYLLSRTRTDCKWAIILACRLHYVIYTGTILKSINCVLFCSC